MGVDRDQQVSFLINTVWAFVDEHPVTCVEMCALFSDFAPQLKQENSMYLQVMFAHALVKSD